MVSSDTVPLQPYKRHYNYLTFTECSKEYLKSTTFHGLRRTGWTRSAFMKLVWLLLWMIGLAMFIYMLVVAVHRYYDYPKVTHVYKQMGYYTFPGVTICNTNPINKENIKDILDPLYVFQKNANYTFNDTYGTVDPETHTRQEYNKIIAKMDYDQRVAYGHKLKEIVVYCAYNGRACDLHKDFSEPVWNDYYGACHTFGGMKPNENATTIDEKYVARNEKMVGGAGWLHGLQLILATQATQHLNKITEDRGVRILLHPPATMPFPNDEGLSIAAGVEAMINVQLEHVSRLEKPAMSCMPHHTKNRYNFMYSQTACRRICKQERVWEHCLCVDPSYQVDSFARTCSLNDIYSKEYICYQSVMTMFTSGKLKCNCPPPCHENRYKYDVSLAKWPTGINDYKHNYCAMLKDMKIDSEFLEDEESKTKCRQVMNNYYCGCRESMAENILIANPQFNAMPVCDASAANINSCLNRIATFLDDGTLTCDCSTELSYAKNILDELTRKSVNWEQTGRASYKISRRQADYTSIKVFMGMTGRVVYEEHSTYTLFNFLTEIGGISALFIGASFVTWIEVIEYLLTMCLIPCVHFPPWVSETEKQRRQRYRMWYQDEAMKKTGSVTVINGIDEEIANINSHILPHKYDEEERKPITAS